ncbi:unnamed protein product [Dibothriocephalus latus]|uniref:C2H2-type domain-containing protein n=1 Tax=Dibothriocephalus latus TaxID=60516 RepID=A0A3P7NSZ5_DIBLA|nr:unnamed protein product [Dibothriocephalus latus]
MIFDDDHMPKIIAGGPDLNVPGVVKDSGILYSNRLNLSQNCDLIVSKARRTTGSLHRNFKPIKPQRRRQQLTGQQDLRGSNGSDCASIGDAWHPSPASSPSSAEVNHGRLTPTFSSSVPTGDLNAATCLSIPPKVSAPTSPLESNTSELGRFSCEICSKTLGDRAKLKDHIDNVHNSKSHSSTSRSVFSSMYYSRFRFRFRFLLREI